MVRADDVEMIRSYIVQTQLLASVERGMSDITSAKASLKGVMLRCFEYLAKRAGDDLADVKRELYRRGIRVDETEPLRYRYRCRGEEGVIDIGRDTLKTEIGAVLARYMDGIFRRSLT